MIKIGKINILLIEDEDYDVRRIRNTVKPFDGQLIIKDVVSDGRAALDLIKKGNEYDVVIMDFQISGGLKGERLIKKLKELDHTLQIIVVTKMTMNMTDFDFANKLIEASFLSSKLVPPAIAPFKLG